MSDPCWAPYLVGIDMPLQVYGETPSAQTGVYFLFAADGGMLYVGKSVNIEYRLLQHERAGKAFGFFGCIEVPDALMSGVECAYIDALEPCQNGRPGHYSASWHGGMVAAIRVRWKLAITRRRLS